MFCLFQVRINGFTVPSKFFRNLHVTSFQTFQKMDSISYRQASFRLRPAREESATSTTQPEKFCRRGHIGVCVALCVSRYVGERARQRGGPLQNSRAAPLNHHADGHWSHG